ncbi:MAG: hypothetical protein H6619_04365 [Deltaproteobacteria bacterium]|nr:hypothetical protein [Deltaproteobacteria bacterium]
MKSTLIDCLRFMMRPIARFCLRRSLTIQDFIENGKAVFLEVAAEELERNGQKVNISRLSVSTGMHRRDVMRIHRDKDIKQQETGFVSRVIGQWQQNKRFLTKTKKPKVLTIDGDNCEFNRLVRTISRDIHPGTVLFELERINAVERTPNGVKLIARSYVPKHNPAEGFRLLAEDTSDLMMTIEDNIFLDDNVEPNLHAKTEYDSVPAEDAEKIRSWLVKEGSALHQKARNYLAQFDTDINPKKKGTGKLVRVVLGSYGRVAPPE